MRIITFISAVVLLFNNTSQTFPSAVTEQDALRPASVALAGKESGNDIGLDLLPSKVSKGDLKIVVQSGAGELSGYSDEEYLSAGAEIVETAKEVWQKAHIVFKVKEPLAEGNINEFQFLRNMRHIAGDTLVIGVVKEIKPNEGRAALLPDGVKELIEFSKAKGCSVGDMQRLLFTYFHFAASRSLTEDVLNTGISALTLEAIIGDASEAPFFNTPEYIDSEGSPGRIVIPGIVRAYKQRLGATLICLDPMSIVAGIEAVLQGIVYMNPEKVRVDSRIVTSEAGWPNLVLDSYPDSPDMNALEGDVVFITGAGTAGLSALWQARRLGAKVIISDIQRNLPLLFEILTSTYPGAKAVVSRMGDNIAALLNKHDIVMIDSKDGGLTEESIEASSVIIGAALIPRGKAPITVTASQIKKACDNRPMRRVMVDIAIDQGGNIEVLDASGETVKGLSPRYHDDPVIPGYGETIYYRVGNMPGRPGVISSAASRMLQAARLPYAKALIKNGLIRSAAEDEGLRAGISIVNGALTDPAVAATKGFNFKHSPVDKALIDLANSLPDRIAQPAKTSSTGNLKNESGPVFSVPEDRCTLLSDEPQELIHTTPLPANKKVAVLEVKKGEAALYADMLIERLSGANNKVRTFSAYGTTDPLRFRHELSKYNPDIIVLPQHEDRSRANIILWQIVLDVLSPLNRDGAKVLIGYDTPRRIFNYNLFCPLTKGQWQKVMNAMAAHVSQMERVAYDKAVDAQARANALLLRKYIEPRLPDRFEYVLMFQLKRIENGESITPPAQERFIYYPSDIGGLKSFWPKNATITANAPHPDDTEIGLGAPFAISAAAGLNNDILSAVSTVGWRVVIKGVDDEDYHRKIDIRLKEAEEGARRLGINMQFLNHPASLNGIGLPFYGYRVNKEMPDSEKEELSREERSLVDTRIRKRYQKHLEHGRDMFILCNPEASDKHPDHLISRGYWLDAAEKLSAENGITITVMEFISPWAGDFNAYVYGELPRMPNLGSGKPSILTKAADLTMEANAPPGGELILSGGFAGRPPELPLYAQRFKIRRLKDYMHRLAVPMSEPVLHNNNSTRDAIGAAA